MKTLALYVVGFFSAAAALIGFTRRSEKRGAKKQAEKQRAAARAVEKSLERVDKAADDAASKKALALRSALEAEKRRIDAGAVTAEDVQAAVERAKGKHW